MRANSLTNLGVALDYNVASDYDKVLVVAGLAEEIEALAPHANEIATLVANLPDVLTVQEASELVNNLTVKVTTLPAGATATSELVGTEIRLGIPAGTQGVQGIQGPKGDTGDHVHHTNYQRSKDSLGNDIGPTEPGRPGYNDTYAMWASQEELPETYIGEFTVHNGLNTLTAEEQAKLDSVEFGATRDQVASEVPYDNTISGLLSKDIQNSIDELSATKLNLIEKGQHNGVASLDSNGLVPSTQLPSYVDDVIEVGTKVDLPATGEQDKIYIVVNDETSNGDTSTYRWTGTVYAMVNNTLNASDVKALYESNPDTNEYSDAEKVLVNVSQVLETTATTLPTAINELVSVKVNKIVGSSLVPDTKVSLYDSHIIDTANPHTVTKAQVGLSNAEDTKDNVKNVLSATKWTTARTITLSGDVSGSAIVDGSANVTMSTTVQPNSVALGTDTTGNYMVGIIAGSGLSVSHTQGEGSTATITNSNPNVTTDITTTHTSTNVVVNSSDGTDGTINAATQTLAGVMSAADKTKLDGIGGGTPGAQTANEILTLLNTVDGSGSGIDADLLDGQEGAYYLNASNLNSGTVNADRLPATITSSTTGNAATATKLATARTINGVSFNGSANITISDSTKVALTGNETIAGIKTFSSSPIVPTPTTDTQATNKQYVDGKYSGFKNFIINGGFDIWQRGASQTTYGYGSADRWYTSNIGSTKTYSQVACTDTERALFNASKFSRTVVSSVTDVGNFVATSQRIEDVTKLAGKTITVSFWAKADSNKNIWLEFIQMFGTGGSPSVLVNGIYGQAVGLTTTWQKKTITLTLPSIIGKTVGTDGLHTSYTELQFWIDIGSNYLGRMPTGIQQSGTFDIAQVQLEEGSVATPFEDRPIGLELSLCQRYYEIGFFKHWSITSGVGQALGSTLKYSAQKRVNPTISVLNLTLVNCSSVMTSESNLTSLITYGVSSTPGLMTFGYNWTASAEL